MPFKDPARAKYMRQCIHCNNRGIEMRFTFEEWVAWWIEHLGPDWESKRGCQREQYVMAREGDQGHYEPGNVLCITNSQNVSDGHKTSPRDTRGNRAFLGKLHSAEYKAKMSSNHSGEKNPFSGKKHTPEARAKMRMARIGGPNVRTVLL